MAKLNRRVDRIVLDGTTYGLDLPSKSAYRESFYKKYPQKSFVLEGQAGEFWREWTMRSWHGGERLKKILSEDDLNSFRYDDAEGLDEALLANWGELKLASAMSAALSVNSGYMPITIIRNFMVLVGLEVSPYIKYWAYGTGWTDAAAVAGSGAVTDLITAGAVSYGVRGGGVITSTNYGANWSAVGSYTTAVGVAVVNGDLFVAKSDGLYNHTDSEAITTEPLTCVAGYKENVYAACNNRLFRYDGRAFYLYDELPPNYTITSLLAYRSILIVLGYYRSKGAYKGSVYYLISGNENHLYSAGGTAYYRPIYACAVSEDALFFANCERGGADRYDLELGGLSNAPNWTSSTTDVTPFKSMTVCDGYLFIGRRETATGGSGKARASGSDATHTTLAASGPSASNDYYNTMLLTFTGGTGVGQTTTITDYDGTTKIATHGTLSTPADGTTVYNIGPATNGIWYADIDSPTAWNTSGWLTTAEYDFGLANQAKLFGSIYLEFRALVQGESIKVEYSTDGGTTYFEAGTASSAGTTSEEFTLDNVTGNSIKLKLMLAGAGTSTPTLTKVVTKAAPFGDNKLMWDVNILVREAWGGAESVASMWAAWRKNAQLDFTDRDGETYKVIIEELVEDPDIDPAQNHARINLRLREI